jgi:hypothetical protein
MRFLLLAATASLSLAMATFACSSTPTPTATEGDSGTPALPKDDTPPADPPGSSSGDPPPVDAGPTDSAVPDDGGGGSTMGDAGSKCLPTSIRESETNNDVASADVVPGATGTYCGRLTPGTDADFMVFTMPAQVSTFNLAIDDTTSGQIRVEPSADGEDFNFNSNDYPFKPGKPYVLKIRSNNNSPLEYRIKVTINQ